MSFQGSICCPDETRRLLDVLYLYVVQKALVDVILRDVVLRKCATYSLTTCVRN